MKVLERGMILVGAMLALAALTQSVARGQYAPGMPPAFAQGYAAPPGGPGYGPPPGFGPGGPGGQMPYPGVIPAGAAGPAGGPMEMSPGHYQGPAGGGPVMGPGGPMDGGGYGGGDCPNCGGNGCDHCGHGCCGWLLGCLGFGEGYKCRPRWYDTSIDYMYFKREDVSRFVQITPVVATDVLDFDGASGARVTLARMFAPGTSLEATYMGSFNWGTVGTAAATAGEETLRYNSGLDSIELHLRQRWQEPECRYQTSWIAGFRYIRLDEDLTLLQGLPPAAPAIVGVTTTNNDLYGAQIGGDFVIRPLPRLLMSGEGKVGLYGNSATTAATDGGPALEDTNTEVALVAEFNTNIVYHLTERVSVRGGYTLLYLDGVALAAENFSFAQPVINVNGDVFYHGVNAGMEWTW